MDNSRDPLGKRPRFLQLRTKTFCLKGFWTTSRTKATHKEFQTHKRKVGSAILPAASSLPVQGLPPTAALRGGGFLLP
jgi:hypothetical protein